MNKNLSISESEWSIMELAWEKSVISMSEIISGTEKHLWSESTVKTLVRRLVNKKALGVDKSGTKFKYYPLIDEKECRIAETKNFLNRIYDGSLKMLMANLSADSNLSDKETKQLLEIIDKMEE